MDAETPLQEIMLEFLAGKMNLEGTRVVPDARKGLVRIGRGDEGLIHFQWLDRTQNTVEDDLLILPEEAIFEKVSQSSGRVYILKFRTENMKYFFWMQEPNFFRDAEICHAINDFMNRPIVIDAEDVERLSQHVPETSGDNAEDEPSPGTEDAAQQTVAAADASSEPTSSGGRVQLADLQRILRNIQPAGAHEDPDEGIGLGDILKPDLLEPLVQTLPLEKGLVSHLPEGSWTSPKDFMEVLQSPPFRQQVETFSEVLRTGQVDLAQFGIDPSKYKFSVLSFLEALDDTVAKASGDGDGGERAQRNEDDDAMEDS